MIINQLIPLGTKPIAAFLTGPTTTEPRINATSATFFEGSQSSGISVSFYSLSSYSCFHLEPIHFEHYQYNLGNDSRIKRSSNRSPFQTFMISMNKMRGADWRQWSDHAGSNLEDMGDMMIEANNKFSEAVRYLYG